MLGIDPEDVVRQARLPRHLLHHETARLTVEDDAQAPMPAQAAREPLARHYLLNTSLPFREIAFLLGFDEPTSFSRALREWFGETPGSVRIRAG